MTVANSLLTTENVTVEVGGGRHAVHDVGEANMDGAADARIGDEDAVEALSGPVDVEAEPSRRFGISERTIQRWIAAGQLDWDLSVGAAGYSARPRMPHKLGPYKGIVDARPAEFPRPAAQRLFDEVRAAAYADGSGRGTTCAKCGRASRPSP